MLLTLGVIGVVGLAADRDEPLRVIPSEDVSGDVGTLLANTAELMPAVGSGNLQAWVTENEPLIAEGLEMAEGSPLGEEWEEVLLRFDEIKSLVGGGDRAALLGAVGAYNRAVANLARKTN